MIHILIHLYQRAFAYSPWLAYTTATLLALLVLARLSNVFNFYVRHLTFVVCISVASFIGLVSSLVLVPMGRNSSMNWVVARTFMYAARLGLGIRTEIINPENLTASIPCIYVANHQSSLDLVGIGAVFPENCAITAKRSLKYTPLLGQFMTLANNIFIDRGNRDEAVKIFQDAVKTIHKKQLSVFIFPEGTRGRLQNASLLPFKKGAFHMAVQAGIPIVPIVFSDFHSFYCKQELRYENGLIKIQVLPPISTEGKTADDVEKLAIDTREVMIQALGKISDSSKKHD
ncbi:hypothetical protein BJ085DRAFT_24175 [Dimargaris cristalligena]|uniref:1-acyl-sn-glycerol-3-phosphate acyltransferase n=1 Tax=Dimargaris cristalligena TaxID=215637 RepID=A0A4P9ZQI3_9FUNG|nr:hypothetical protein BJ085DRAFT_24175 [Dimargaris cristalligena]|eukprot:RKP35744.1 hypothetical protein BJ085DRAFT_24175 [Dimargaris cristalligena]